MELVELGDGLLQSQITVRALQPLGEVDGAGEQHPVAVNAIGLRRSAWMT